MCKVILDMLSVDHVAHFVPSSPEPVITAIVSGGTPTVGENYSLTCTVTGADRLNPTITYRWFKNTALVSGERQTRFLFPSLSLSDAGQYRCRVTVSSTLLSQSTIVLSNTQDLTRQSKRNNSYSRFMITSSFSDCCLISFSSTSYCYDCNCLS